MIDHSRPVRDSGMSSRPDSAQSVLRQPVIIDLRNIYPPAEMRALGFTYRSIGRPRLDRGDETG